MKIADKKYNSIDLLKLIMAVCVVAIHTKPLYKCNNEAAIGIYNTIVGVANPFFFLASGFFVGKKYFGGGAKYPLYFAACKKTSEVVFNVDAGLLSVSYL